jgi:hypothetical protein
VLLVLVALVVLAAAGCQLQVDTTVVIEEDGSGEVVQAVGLDAAALARIGDLERQVAVADLEAAGWIVEDPVTEGELTWIRARRPVEDTTELAVVLSQLNGPGGPFLDIAAGRRDAFFERVTELNATYDLTAGAGLFSDPELDAVEGNPFGALLAEVEAEEGRPIAEMVDFSVTVELPGGYRETWTPGFDDPAPTTVAARSAQSRVVERLVQGALVALVVATVLFGWWAWATRRRRSRRVISGWTPRR